MNTTARLLGAAVMALLLSRAVGAGGDGATYRGNVAYAASAVGREIEWFQEAVYNEPAYPRARGVWEQTEKVSQDLQALQKLLQNGAPRSDLYAAFSKLDVRMQSLIDDINTIGVATVPYRRAASRLSAAEHDLHFALTAGDKSDGLRWDLLQRQSAALDCAVQDMEGLGSYLFDGKDAWTFLRTDLRKLREASAEFRKGVKRKPQDSQLQKDFAPIQRAWQDLATDYSLLPNTSSLLLQSYAGRLDGVYGRLYGLVGMPGDRTRLLGGS